MTDNQCTIIFRKIGELAKKRGISVSKAMRGIDISESSYYSMKERNNISVETLEKIALFFEVPITYFFIDGDLPAASVEAAAGKERLLPTHPTEKKSKGFQKLLALREMLAKKNEEFEREREEWKRERVKLLTIMENQAKL